MATKKKSTVRDHLKELKEEVLQMELSTSDGNVRDALRKVMEHIDRHQSK